MSVWCTWPPGATFEDAATYLTGPVLGFLLRLRGALAFHASAVQLEGGAFVLVGPHGAGKSTAATALGRRGCPIITDDVLHVTPAEGRWLAQPFPATLRLWPDSVRLALGVDSTLPRITPTWDKRALEIGMHRITGASHPVPMCGIAFLDKREPSFRAPRIDALGGAAALVRLATHSSASHLLDDEARAREFMLLGRLVRDVPCVSAVAANTEAHFDAFIDLLYEWAIQRCAIDAT